MNTKMDQILEELNKEGDEFIRISLIDIGSTDIDKMIENGELCT